MDSSEFSSPFARVLDTNYAPTADERAEIGTLLHGPEEKLRTLKEEISKLQAERDKLQSFIDRHQRLLSPFRRLPADVWREVFVQCLPENEIESDSRSLIKVNFPGRSVKDAPLLLTVVCRSWREIALETPRLWNRLHIYLPQSRPDYPDESLFTYIRARREGVESWLSRAGALPIGFSLTFGSHLGAPPLPDSTQDTQLEECFTEITSSISRYSDRLQTLVLSRRFLEGPFFGQPLVELTRDKMPVLENLYLLGGLLFNDNLYRTFDTAVPPEGARTPVVTLLTQLHTVRSVHLASEHLEGFLSLELNWSSLTELHVTSPLNWNDPAVIIPRIGALCPFLTVLHLEINFDRSTDHLTTTISLPSLKALQLSVTRIQGPYAPVHDSLRAVFECLEVPQLTCFSLIIDMNRYAELDIPGTIPFYSLFSKYGSSLTHLTIGGDFLLGEPQKLLRSLEFLPSLLSLHLKARERPYAPDATYWSDPRPVLTGLIAAEAGICPLLQELRIDGCGSCHVDAIIAFSSARPRLTALLVDFGAIDKEGIQTMKSDRVLTTLKNLREVKGVHVDWTWLEAPGMPVDFFDHPYAGLNGMPFGQWFV